MSSAILFQGTQSPSKNKSTLFAYAAWTVITVFFLLPITLPMALLAIWRWKTTNYKITESVIETETGLLSRTGNSMELWRVKDIQFQQTFVQRLFNEASLLVVSQDQTHPVAEITGIGVEKTRELFAKLQPCVNQARINNKVMALSN